MFGRREEQSSAGGLACVRARLEACAIVPAGVRTLGDENAGVSVNSTLPVCPRGVLASPQSRPLAGLTKRWGPLRSSRYQRLGGALLRRMLPGNDCQESRRWDVSNLGVVWKAVLPVGSLDLGARRG